MEPHSMKHFMFFTYCSIFKVYIYYHFNWYFLPFCNSINSSAYTGHICLFTRWQKFWSHSHFWSLQTMTMNRLVLVYVDLWLWYILRSKSIGPYGNSMLKSLMKHQLIFCSGYTVHGAFHLLKAENFLLSHI